MKIVSLLPLFVLCQQGLALAADDPKQTASKSGYQLGSFVVTPEMGMTGVYDDNIFATRTDRQSDQILIFSPSLNISSDWQKHELEFFANADIGRYRDYDTEDYDDFSFGTSGRYDISDKDNLFAGLSYSEDHESRASPDSFFGRYPTEYSSLDAHAGTIRQLGQFAMRFGGTWQQLDFDDVPTESGILNNDDRDRDIYGLGLRITYNKTASMSPFVQAIYDRREYQNTPDDNLFERDSDGYRLAAGFSSTISQKLKSEVYLGHLWQHYEDAAFSDISKPDFGASVRWLSNPSTLISASIERDITETTLFASPGAVETLYSASLQHRLLPYLILKSHISWSEYDYQEINREDDYLDVGFGLQYDLSQHVYLSADYRYLHRDSSVDFDRLENALDYDSHQIFLSINARLYPVRNELDTSMSRVWGSGNAAESGPYGFYVGGQMGYNTLATHSSEQRTDGGDDDARYGEAGVAGGLFGGYGWNRNHWYLGLELETENSGADWYHRKSKADSRTSSLEKNQSVGASLRLGRALVNNSLLYARIGAVRTEFDAFYQLNDEPQNAYDKDFDLNGLRLGVGVELDLTEQWFARLDYTFTNYEDKDLTSTGFDEDYAIRESLFNLGIGWRFGAVPKHQLRVEPDSLAGPYAGVHMGYGMTASDLSGLHRDQGMGPYDFNAEFADHGFTPGVFAGYAINWQRMLLALELEAEVTSLEWEHERNTNGGGGRDFSVEAGETIGAAIKLGYILDSGSVLYLRAGPVRTEFTTQWRKGNNASLDIEREDSLHGFRFGLGAEVPLTKQSFVRLDYTRTNYESYDFVTAHGGGSNSDEMSFENSSNLFRLGLGIRF